ncbi:MAG: hypothetical protein ACK4PN_09030 [Allorhizobium sp.]
MDAQDNALPMPIRHPQVTASGGQDSLLSIALQMNPSARRGTNRERLCQFLKKLLILPRRIYSKKRCLPSVWKMADNTLPAARDRQTVMSL